MAAQTALEAARQAEKDEEKNMHCDQCDQDFTTKKGWQQHKKFLKHNPISELICPLSDECTKIFTAPSALLVHLESGACKSGMNRVKLNALIHEHDTGQLITTSENAIGALAAAGTANALASQDHVTASLGALSLASVNLDRGDLESASTSSGVIIEDDVSDTDSIGSGVLICTPTLSRSSSVSEGGVMLRSTSSE
ncbi:Putative Zinc finger C2H2-type [Septoria linicola]|uniref:Zinc finger C2H2-type n=1 Tax=Septoria linicola TaxID=215465 RepID=A0A9Q9AKV8_9PEZI|nr:putative Zinc finger C2H2-type [Septoria linicola]USW50900.1 Putative Zinc finger C2H2-type [Septoria linicola]